MTRRAVAPDGTEWTVSRRREPGDDAPDESEFAKGPVGWAVTAVLIVLLIGVSFVTAWAAVVVATVLAAVEALSWIAGQRRQPWLVEATAPGREHDHAWRVVGRRRSRQVEAEVAHALERGQVDVSPPAAERLR